MASVLLRQGGRFGRYPVIGDMRAKAAGIACGEQNAVKVSGAMGLQERRGCVSICKVVGC